MYCSLVFPDASVVQQQIGDINNRYTQLGSKLQDRKSELDLMTEEAKKHTDTLRTLAAFLDKIERQLPRDSAVPQTRDDAEKQLRSVKNVLEDMYDKQPQLDSLKTQVKLLNVFFISWWSMHSNTYIFSILGDGTSSQKEWRPWR